MKTNEFIKKVKSLGFEVGDEYDRKGEPVEFWIGDDEQDFVVIWPKFTFAISTIEGGFTDWKYPLPLEELYKLCFEYASTPVKDREEEKKFYLRHKYLQSSLTNPNNILCYAVSDDKLALCNGVNFPKYKSYLTLKEIEEIKEKFDTDLSDFELVEVEE